MNLYCKPRNCIVRERTEKKIVLQYDFCIVEIKRFEGCLYCNTIFCIVIKACVGWDCIAGFVLQETGLHEIVLQYNVLYCGRRQGCLCLKTGSCVAIQQGLGSRRARRGCWARGARAAGRGRGAAGARGARAGYGLCTRLVFDPI